MFNQMNPCKRIQGVCCLCDDTSTCWWLQFQSMQAIQRYSQSSPRGGDCNGSTSLHGITYHVSVTLLLRKQPYLLCSSHQCHIDAPLWSYNLLQALNLLHSPCHSPLQHAWARVGGTLRDKMEARLPDMGTKMHGINKVASEGSGVTSSLCIQTQMSTVETHSRSSQPGNHPTIGR